MPTFNAITITSRDRKGQNHNMLTFLWKKNRTLQFQIRSLSFWWKQIRIVGNISRKTCTHHNSVDFSAACSLSPSLRVKHTIMRISIIIISINWIVSSFCWSPIRFDVWGEYKGHWGLCMMYYWMEMNGSLFCQLLLAISPTICCVLQKEEGLLFLSLLFLFLSVCQKNRMRLRALSYTWGQAHRAQCNFLF